MVPLALFRISEAETVTRMGGDGQVSNSEAKLRAGFNDINELQVEDRIFF